MEAGAPGVPMDPAVKHVVEEQKSNIDPVTVHGLNTVVGTALDHPPIVDPVTQTHVVPMVTMQSGGAGDSGTSGLEDPDFIRDKVPNMNIIVFILLILKCISIFRPTRCHREQQTD